MNYPPAFFRTLVKLSACIILLSAPICAAPKSNQAPKKPAPVVPKKQASPKKHNSTKGTAKGTAKARRPGTKKKAAPTNRPPRTKHRAGKPSKKAGKYARKSGPVTPNLSARRSVAGGKTADDAKLPSLPPELLALRSLEAELFPRSARQKQPSLTTDSGSWAPNARPLVFSSGLPPQPRSLAHLSSTKIANPKQPAWVQSLVGSDLATRLDARIIRYLEFFRDDPRGRNTLAYAYRKSGLYADMIRKELRAEHLPEDLLWVAVVESGMNPKISSHAGAAGLWQFMPHAGTIYGLRVERWLDERLDPTKSTRAAVKYLSDLHQRFGNWELVLAAYNMGFGGVLSAVRKYGTNDFWTLASYEAGVPWETAVYVPKIIAFSIAARNPKVFHLTDIQQESPSAIASVDVHDSLTLESIAKAASIDSKELKELNPHLLAERIPPKKVRGKNSSIALHVPREKLAKVLEVIKNNPKGGTSYQEYHVRFGDTIGSIAHSFRVFESQLRAVNHLAAHEHLQAGEVLLIPNSTKRYTAQSADRPVVVAPAFPQKIPGKQRVFYRSNFGDHLRDIALAFHVSQDDLIRWNKLDPTARLQSGMVVQVFVDTKQDLSNVVALREQDVRVLTLGSHDFFSWFEAQKGRKRIVIQAKPSDTMRSISRNYQCSVGMLARINRCSPRSVFQPNQSVIVYTKRDGNDPPLSENHQPQPLPPLVAPHPERLP
jgi:membrane-bound lytic murein transglycosylase D